MGLKTGNGVKTWYMEQRVPPVCYPAAKNCGGQPDRSLEKVNGPGKYMGFPY